MLAIWVKVKVKPDHEERFLEAIEVDALGSERDEPGCLSQRPSGRAGREHVLLLRVYKTSGAPRRIAPRRTSVWRAAADSLDGDRGHALQARVPANRPTGSSLAGPSPHGRPAAVQPSVGCPPGRRRVHRSITRRHPDRWTCR